MRRGEDRPDVSEAQAAAELPSRPAGPGEADADRLPVQHGRVQGPVGINTRRARILVEFFHVIMLYTTLNTCTPARPTHPPLLSISNAPPLHLLSLRSNPLPHTPLPKKSHSHSHPKRNETFPPAIPPKKPPRPSVRLMTPIPQTTALYNIKRTESVPASLTRSQLAILLPSLFLFAQPLSHSLRSVSLILPFEIPPPPKKIKKL